MDLYQLEYFVEVTREGSFTRAARKAGIVQPALSQHIKRLEDEFGTQLFIRDRRQVRLTSAGETLLEHAHQLLARAALAREAVQGLDRLASGAVSIAAIPAVSAFFLPDRVHRFRTKHPGLELVIHEESSTGVAERVSNGSAEVGFLQLPEPDQRLEITPLLSEPFRLLVHQRHRLGKARSISLKQLADEPFILYRGKVRDSVLQACRQSGFEPRIACATSELATVHAMVQTGLGISILPEMAASRNLKGTRVVSLRRPGLTRQIGLVFRRNAPRSSALEAFLMELNL
jgi:LysR family hydrogen peroxide-inducible transcriptional activator